MAHLLRHRKLSEGVTLLLDERLTAILRTHAAVSVIGHGGARRRAGRTLGAALNSVKAVSGSAYRVTIPRSCILPVYGNAPAAVRHRGNW